GAVQKYDNKIPPYPETRNYVKLVTEFYQLYQPSVAARIQRIRMTLPARRNLPEPLPELSSPPASLPDPFAE
ncbi:MAG TPA: lytic transglycosylase domain-containing protein, partial [Burkholderiaceae bacterium]|nr:lytic transglycosylase domain-containing protein [Burkholderiaceae bacterium]